MTRAMRSQDDARPDREARREQGGRPASELFECRTFGIPDPAFQQQVNVFA